MISKADRIFNEGAQGVEDFRAAFEDWEFLFAAS